MYEIKVELCVSVKYIYFTKPFSPFCAHLILYFNYFPLGVIATVKILVELRGWKVTVTRVIKKDTCTENKLLNNVLIAVIGQRKMEIKEIKQCPPEKEN